MKSLFHSGASQEILERMNQLTPDTPHLWGKMSVDQMLAHCATALDMASGKINPPRVFMGRIIGSFMKDLYSNDKPFSKNSPTDDALRINGSRDFAKEKQRLKDSVTDFSKNGLPGVTVRPHPFFGKLSPEAWGIGMYKHTDHHFRQFGV